MSTGEAADEQHERLLRSAFRTRIPGQRKIAVGEAAEDLVEAVIGRAGGTTALRTLGLRSSEESAGESVSAFMAEKSTEMAIVIAKLLVEAARDAADEGHGNEDRGEHERDGNDRSGHLLHRLAVASLGVFPCSMWCITASTTNDGVVHHDPDREHQPEERERVHREPEEGEGDEGAESATPGPWRAG